MSNPLRSATPSPPLSFRTSEANSDDMKGYNDSLSLEVKSLRAQVCDFTDLGNVKELVLINCRLPLWQQIAFFCSQIHNRSFDEETLRILESMLVSKGVESLIGVRSALKQFMRCESLTIIREITGEPVELKLICADFLIRVFALIGDAESCLALRYEALVMREQKTMTHPRLQVSFEEWQTLAEHLIEKGFYSVANKVCDKALICLKTYHTADSKAEAFLQDVHAIEKIKGLKDAAVLSMSSQSVQTKAAEYLKQKTVQESTQLPITSIGTQFSGSSRFRSGIRKRNFHRLKQFQGL